MKYILNFLFLSINAALGPLIVIIYARKDIQQASEFSYLLAVVSLIFSIGLLNQRNYIFINENKAFSYSSQFTFRIFNCTLLFSIVMFFYLLNDIGIKLLILIFLLKISETILDFKHTLVSQRESVKVLASLMVAEVIPRVLILLITVAFVSDLVLLYEISIIIIIIAYFSLRFTENVKFEFKDYSKILYSIKSLGVVGLLTSVFSMLPRLLLEPSEHEAELVALSLSPLLGLIFQSVWISMANKLKEYNKKLFINYIIKILFLEIVILLSYYLWGLIAYNIYGFESKENVEGFSGTIIASATLFACASLCNLLKIIKVHLDILAYTVSIAVMILMSMMNYTLIISIITSALLMLLIFIYGFLSHEKYSFYKK